MAAPVMGESDSDEEVADEEMQLPSHKVKLIIGAGGEKIKWIQKKSKCRVQVRDHQACVLAAVEAT